MKRLSLVLFLVGVPSTNLECGGDEPSASAAAMALMCLKEPTVPMQSVAMPAVGESSLAERSQLQCSLKRILKTDSDGYSLRSKRAKKVRFSERDEIVPSVEKDESATDEADTDGEEAVTQSLESEEDSRTEDNYQAALDEMLEKAKMAAQEQKKVDEEVRAAGNDQDKLKNLLASYPQDSFQYNRIKWKLDKLALTHQ